MGNNKIADEEYEKFRAEQKEKMLVLLTDDFLEKLLQVYWLSDWGTDLIEIHHFVADCFAVANKEFDFNGTSVKNHPDTIMLDKL
jgi:hypothetical protein